MMPKLDIGGWEDGPCSLRRLKETEALLSIFLDFHIDCIRVLHFIFLHLFCNKLCSYFVLMSKLCRVIINGETKDNTK